MSRVKKNLTIKSERRQKRKKRRRITVSGKSVFLIAKLRNKPVS